MPCARGEDLRLAPQRRDLDAVDAVAPRVPLREHRLVQPIRELLAVVLDGDVAERAQLGGDLAASSEEGARSTTAAADRRRTGCRGEVAPGRTPWRERTAVTSCREPATRRAGRARRRRASSRSPTAAPSTCGGARRDGRLDACGPAWSAAASAPPRCSRTTATRLTLRLAITGPAPAPMPVELVLAVPRPKVLTRDDRDRRGVRRRAGSISTNAWRVDKSYLDSPRLAPERARATPRGSAPSKARPPTCRRSRSTTGSMGLLDTRWPVPTAPPATS